VSGMATELEFRPTDPGLVRDPFPVYRRMREVAPVYWDPESSTWYLTRYADVMRLLHDPRGSSRLPGRIGAKEGPYQMTFALVTDDPPHHTRLRRLASKAFTPRMVEQLRGRVGQVVNALLDRVQPRGGMDVVRDFGHPLPLTVIAEMLGIPAELRERFFHWSVAILVAADRNRAQSVDAPAEETALAADLAEYRAAVLRLIDERRREPGEDLISALVHVSDGGDVLGESELLGLVSLLIMAGHVTVTSLLSGGLLILLRHPEQLARLRRDPDLVEPAVEELLRYWSPGTMSTRIAAGDLEIGGQVIRAGQFASAVLAAANHDPEVFQDPDELDLGRHPNPHVAFAHGTHFCLGAPLTRLEGQVAFPLLLERLPGLRLAGDPVPWPTLAVRGLASLPVAFG
jgi:cytochrome P450